MSRPKEPLNRRRCRNCDEYRPDAMTRHGLCYECRREAQGLKRTEEHHVFGRGRPDIDATTVEMPGNWHRVLGAACERRAKLLKRPGDNPLHQIAAVSIASGEVAAAFAEYARGQIWPDWAAGLADIFAEADRSVADWLLILAAKLEDQLDPDWVEKIDMPQWHL
jgi:hypothetical protein